MSHSHFQTSSIRRRRHARAADVLCRLYSLIDHRKEIINETFQWLQNFSRTHAIATVDRFARQILTAANAMQIFKHGVDLIKLPLGQERVKEIVVIGGLAAGFTMVSVDAVKTLLPQLPSEYSALLTIFTSTVIAAAVSVSLGVSDSLKEIVKDTYPIVLTAALVAGFTYFLKSWIYETFDRAGFPQGRFKIPC